MRIGVVGSRRRTDREAVEAFIAELAPETVVVKVPPSGRTAGRNRRRGDAASGAWCTSPTSLGAHTRWQAADQYYARNQAIVDDSERIIAFVVPGRTGGTKDAIRRAERAGKPVDVR